MPQTDAHHKSESSEVTLKVNLSHHFLFTVHSKAVSVGLLFICNRRVRVGSFRAIASF